MQPFLDTLKTIVGRNGLIDGDELGRRRVGWRDPSPLQALAMVLPSSTEQLSRVLALCNQRNQAVVPFGGNTGLVQGTASDRSELLVSTARMNAIEETDTAGGTMTVQAGVAIQKVQETAADQGWFFPVDFGARGSATVGGALSTNAGGNGVIRFGMMREQLLGLEAVLADGTVISSMNRMLKNNAGYDLKQLFVGSEGTLGMIARAVLRLRPGLESRNTALLAIESFEKVPETLNHLGRSLGGTLSAFEVLWADFYDLITASNRHARPLDTEAPFYVLAEASGGDIEGDALRFSAALESLLELGLVADAALTQSQTQREALWAIRDDIDYLYEQLDPAITFDISLPISDANTYVSEVRLALTERWPKDFRSVTFGHLGDSNIHFVMTIGSEQEADQREAMEIVYRYLEPYGGSVSAEHGIGLEKRPYLGLSRSDDEIALMRLLKASLDPNNILNPGKVFEPN